MPEIMFRQSVTAADGTTTGGTCGEARARSLLATALRRGYTVEATRPGGVIITRPVHAGRTIPGSRTVTLTPAVPLGALTQTVHADLAAIAARTARRPAYLITGAVPAHARGRAGRICAGLYAVPPAATRKLVERGLVTLGAPPPAEPGSPPEERVAVTVSLAAWLAIHAAGHRTETQQPRGWVRPAQIGLTGGGVERKGNRVYDRSSVAHCACRWSYPAEDRDDARRRTAAHRQQTTAAMLRTLLEETQ
jgi:hypothetical protein